MALSRQFSWPGLFTAAFFLLVLAGSTHASGALAAPVAVGAASALPNVAIMLAGEDDTRRKKLEKAGVREKSSSGSNRSKAGKSRERSSREKARSNSSRDRSREKARSNSSRDRSREKARSSSSRDRSREKASSNSSRDRSREKASSNSSRDRSREKASSSSRRDRLRERARPEPRSRADESRNDRRERLLPGSNSRAGDDARRRGADDARRRALDNAQRRAADNARRADDDARGRAADDARRHAAEDLHRRQPDPGDSRRQEVMRRLLENQQRSDDRGSREDPRRSSRDARGNDRQSSLEDARRRAFEDALGRQAAQEDGNRREQLRRILEQQRRTALLRDGRDDRQQRDSRSVERSDETSRRQEMLRRLEEIDRERQRSNSRNARDARQPGRDRDDRAESRRRSFEQEDLAGGQTESRREMLRRLVERQNAPAGDVRNRGNRSRGDDSLDRGDLRSNDSNRGAGTLRERGTRDEMLRQLGIGNEPVDSGNARRSREESPILIHVPSNRARARNDRGNDRGDDPGITNLRGNRSGLAPVSRRDRLATANPTLRDGDRRFDRNRGRTRDWRDPDVIGSPLTRRDHGRTTVSFGDPPRAVIDHGGHHGHDDHHGHGHHGHGHHDGGHHGHGHHGHGHHHFDYHLLRLDRHHDLPHWWYWSGAHHRDWYRWCDDWSGWRFSFGYYGGYSSRSWLSFRFGSGFHHDPFYRPWHHYSISYRSTHVRYHRPWRTWYYRHYRPWSACYSYVPAYPSYTIYNYYDDDDYGYRDDYGYDDRSSAASWYAAYRTTAPLIADEAVDAPLLITVDEAWNLLAEGAYEAAEEAFAELIYALPYDGEPRIGYAITVGLLGRDDAAIGSMRRALEDDALALDSVPRDLLTLDRVRLLLDRYADRVRRDFNDADALLMTAALRYLLDEHALSYFAIDSAIRAGDDSDAALKLKVLLEQALYQEM